MLIDVDDTTIHVLVHMAAEIDNAMDTLHHAEGVFKQNQMVIHLALLRGLVAVVRANLIENRHSSEEEVPF